MATRTRRSASLTMPFLLALGVAATACNRGSSENRSEAPADPQPRAVNLPYIQKLHALNHCEEDSDCYDLGYVCGLGCYVPASSRLGADDDDPQALRDIINEQDPCDVTLARSTCGLFFGMTCSEGRCRTRTRPPESDICLANFKPGADGASDECLGQRVPAACAPLLRYAAPSLDCRQFCDGKNPIGTRYWGCGNAGDGCSRCLVIDYVRCSTCEAALASPGHHKDVDEAAPDGTGERP